MGRRKYGAIMIRGVTYPDVNAAAQAFGVGADAIRLAARTGRLDFVGLPRGGVPMRIRIRGVDYQDARHAARALGVTVGAVYQALSCDRLDRLGLPRGGRTRAKSFELFGMRWPSLSAASVDLGFCSSYISLAQRRHSTAMLENIRTAAMLEGMRRGARALAARKRGAEALCVEDDPRRPATLSTGAAWQAGQLARRANPAAPLLGDEAWSESHGD